VINFFNLAQNIPKIKLLNFIYTVPRRVLVTLVRKGGVLFLMNIWREKANFVYKTQTITANY
jgi:hypothetical protein